MYFYIFYKIIFKLKEVTKFTVDQARILRNFSCCLIYYSMILSNILICAFHNKNNSSFFFACFAF